MSLNALCAAWTVYAVDILAVVVLFVFAVAAAKRGFVACFFGLISTLVAILVAFLFMKSLVNWTNGIFGLQTVVENASASGLSKITGFDIDISSQGLETALSGKLPQFLINIVVENVGKSEVPAGTTVAMVVGETIGRLAVSLIAWLALFLVVKLLLRLLERVLSSVIEKIPLVGTLNNLLGFAVGALQGLFVVCGVIAILALIPSESFAAFFNQTVFVKALYNQNPIHVVLGWLVN